MSSVHIMYQTRSNLVYLSPNECQSTCYQITQRCPNNGTNNCDLGWSNKAKRLLESVNEHKKAEKNVLIEKKIKIRTSKKKFMTLNIFEFLDQFMIKIFLIKITQIDKTGSIGKKTFTKKTIIKFHCRN